VLGTFVLSKYKISILENHQIESNPLGQSNNSPFEFNHANESNQIEIKLKTDRQCMISRHHSIAKIIEFKFFSFIDKAEHQKQSQKITFYQPNKHILYRNLLI